MITSFTLAVAVLEPVESEPRRLQISASAGENGPAWSVEVTCGPGGTLDAGAMSSALYYLTGELRDFDRMERGG